MELLIRAKTASGPEQDLDGARSTLEELESIAAQAQTSPLLAAARLSAGLIAVAAGDLDEARRELEDAVDLYEKSGAPFETARTRLDLARALERLNRSEAALGEVSRALEQLARLDARGEIASAAGDSRSSRIVDRTPRARRTRQGRTDSARIEVLRLISSGLSNQSIAERLCISEHTVHRHVANTLSKLDVPSQVGRRGPRRAARIAVTAVSP